MNHQTQFEPLRRRAKISSLARIHTSRANGRLSHGPKTAAGKTRSSGNATRHGLYSRQPLTPAESDPLFNELAAAHRTQFAPRNAAESAIVHELALSQWRTRQLWTLEKQWLDELFAADPEPNPRTRLANAFAALARTSKFALLLRHEGREHRTYRASATAAYEHDDDARPQVGYTQVLRLHDHRGRW